MDYCLFIVAVLYIPPQILWKSIVYKLINTIEGFHVTKFVLWDFILPLLNYCAFWMPCSKPLKVFCLTRIQQIVSILVACWYITKTGLYSWVSDKTLVNFDSSHRKETKDKNEETEKVLSRLLNRYQKVIIWYLCISLLFIVVPGWE